MEIVCFLDCRSIKNYTRENNINIIPIRRIPGTNFRRDYTRCSALLKKKKKKSTMFAIKWKKSDMSSVIIIICFRSIRVEIFSRVVIIIILSSENSIRIYYAYTPSLYIVFSTL